MRRLFPVSTDRPAAWLAIGICASVALLSWFGYRAIVEWRNASILLADRRASEAADLLLLGFARDMSGAQEFVLNLPQWDQFVGDHPQGTSNVAANAFARYPYPESFFAWRHDFPTETAVFFNRHDRRPTWAPAEEIPSLFPVVVERHADTARTIFEHVMRDAARGVELSAFQTTLAGTEYQIVAQLTYSDIFHERLAQVIGFTVNLPWVQQRYFSQLTQEVLSIGQKFDPGLSVSVANSRGTIVAGAALSDPDVHRRQFTPVFFDPDLQVYPSQDLARESWTISVSPASDSSLSRALVVANRMLMIGTVSSLALAIGLILTVRAEKATAQVAQMRSEFVSTVTHELKLPIATIQAAAETLSKGRLSSISFQTCGRIVLMESKRLSHLVENLLAYSRVTDVADIYTFEPLDVTAIFNDIQQDFESQLDQRGFDLEFHVAQGTPRIRADRSALRLLFNNLVDNAVKYSGEGRMLRLAASAINGGVDIEVTDAGVGIPPEEILLVTRKFYRGQAAPSGGSGLGLAIAHRIAEDHGGKLDIRSEVGKGTTVTVSLPKA